MSAVGRLLIKIAAAESTEDEPVVRKPPVVLPGALAAAGALTMGNPFARVRNTVDALDLASSRGTEMLTRAEEAHKNLMAHTDPIIAKNLQRSKLDYLNPKMWTAGGRAKIMGARLDHAAQLLSEQGASHESLKRLASQVESARMGRFMQPARLVGGALMLGYGGKKLYDGMTAPSHEKTSNAQDLARRLT
jgi:hypothetical protein